MSTEENKTIVRRLMQDGFGRGDMKAIDELVAADFVSREGDERRTVGIDGFKEVVMAFRTAFPDGRMDIEDVIAEGEKVITWAYFVGTHQGPLEGMSPTGRQVKVRDVDLFILKDGKVTESWTHFDQLGMMQQLGAFGGDPEG